MTAESTGNPMTAEKRKGVDWFDNLQKPIELDDPLSLVPFGWAPGGYICSRCSSCGKGHVDSDKRSSVCQACAIKRKEENEANRLVTAAEDRGDGDEPKANEPGVVVREWLDMAKRQPINACHVLRHPPISPGELDAIESILALVSRLEETIRADGSEAIDLLSQWLAQSCEDDQVPKLQARTRSFMQDARARLSARQEGGGE